jgi:hypothetical protein
MPATSPTSRHGDCRRADGSGSIADEERQAAGGARREGVSRVGEGRGGPRVSMGQYPTSTEDSGIVTGARRSSTGWAAGARTRDAAPGSAGRASRSVRTQAQSVGHASAPEAGCADARQCASLASTGDTQQQYHGVVPQVRPSHCQTASAWGANAEKSSAMRAIVQIVRTELTLLLWSRFGRAADATHGGNMRASDDNGDRFIHARCLAHTSNDPKTRLLAGPDRPPVQRGPDHPLEELFLP